MHEKDLPDLTQIPSDNDICLFCGYTDLRMSVDGLASKMMFEYGTDTAGKTMLFCGRKPDRIKILYRTPAGYALLYHRYEDTKLVVTPITGRSMDHIPKADDTASERLSHSQRRCHFISVTCKHVKNRQTVM